MPKSTKNTDERPRQVTIFDVLDEAAVDPRPDPVATTAAVTTTTAPDITPAWSTYDWESDGTEDIAPALPVIKLVQPTSSMPGAGQHQGQFWRSDVERFYDTLDVVALYKRETRAMFEPTSDQPVCVSRDGIAPLPGMPLWQGQAEPGSCAQCPYSQWGIDDSPPPCRSSVVLLVHHEDQLAQLRISGTSIRQLRQFIARRLAPRRMPLCSHRLRLYTQERTEPGRRWYELRIDAERLELEDARFYNELLRAERERLDQHITHDTWPDDDVA